MNNNYCQICANDVGPGSHYHCPNCGEVCSMMGHANAHGGYRCDRNEAMAKRVAESRNCDEEENGSSAVADEQLAVWASVGLKGNCGNGVDVAIMAICKELLESRKLASGLQADIDASKARGDRKISAKACLILSKLLGVLT